MLAPAAACRWRQPSKSWQYLDRLETGAISGQGSEFKWMAHGMRSATGTTTRHWPAPSRFRASGVISNWRPAWVPTPTATSAAGRYGWLREPFDLTRFWLDGFAAGERRRADCTAAQALSAQLAVQHTQLRHPASGDAGRTGNGYRLYAKTGWAASQQPQTGWYVGYVENGSEVWLFAGNIDIDNASQLPLRQALTLEALRRKGVLPSSSTQRR